MVRAEAVRVVLVRIDLWLRRRFVIKYLERHNVVLLIALIAVTAPGCDRPAPEPYVPGLGEIMSATQMRHSKLWFAGEAENWPLASFELDELREGFDDAVRFHPTHKDAPVAKLVPEMTAGPLAQLDSAVASRDVASFEKAFDNLTAACNACHRAAQFGFNVIERPTTNPFTNQRFDLPERPDSVR
jgi:hypothetical protein